MQQGPDFLSNAVLSSKQNTVNVLINNFRGSFKNIIEEYSQITISQSEAGELLHSSINQAVRTLTSEASAFKLQELGSLDYSSLSGNAINIQRISSACAKSGIQAINALTEELQESGLDFFESCLSFVATISFVGAVAEDIYITSNHTSV